MKIATSIAAVVALVQSTSAHYIFQQLSVGSTKYPVFQYIRQNTNYNSPVTDLDSNDLRCNVGTSGANTQTVGVKAGDSITFTLDTAVYHQGPISVYMSKAPSTASSYDGSGGWFKIKDWGPTFSGSTSTWPMYISYTFNLPTCIANGEYLLRIQSLGIHNPWPAGIPQFYISCAQISVSGGGSTVPSNQVKIPGAFKETDPGYTANIYSNFNSYTIPGPAVFSCNGAPGGDGGGSDPTTTLQTSTRASSTQVPPVSTQPSGQCALLWAQCGGNTWTGPKCCATGTCKALNDFYSQCTT
ncbi:related to cellulose binding protein CEL1 [Fusarium fujikuroi IMI 58289]|uniref:lytic cellulose monooxygenase (C4-dehydrogenating) n=1 Tax=Gibberella fujikuroi (strain CBS 195.34 / IMI 58289 / NRRL A-6831) TaxID=1279085 RepID=S0EPL9_GIBF5|nr:related to cellulose binding protein CEL1 [Fusarium fujikuroi IMI 58289]CCT75380.1 related to cellulose binding protein CEL1 [Fusarium fujikuroi IMI 58289]SCO25863.1 related to cellulose binding protein CEL1 [Fusarium fujikuroi]SCV49945.1 related to cellulose binding protein CEL1 [Fusarium fujikuroi]